MTVPVEPGIEHTQWDNILPAQCQVGATRYGLTVSVQPFSLYRIVYIPAAAFSLHWTVNLNLPNFIVRIMQFSSIYIPQNER